MSRYIYIDKFLADESEAYMNAQIKLAKENADKTIDTDRYINMLVHKKILMLIADTPSIDLADYVPKEFHDKTCEAMAKRHQEEIADMVSVVRCKECDMSEVYQNDSSGVMARYCRAFAPNRMVADDDYCSFGERDKDINVPNKKGATNE